MSEELFHQDEQVSEVLQQVSSQLRLSLGNIHSALARLAPPDVRDGEEKTDLNAAAGYLEKSAKADETMTKVASGSAVLPGDDAAAAGSMTVQPES